MIKKYFKSLTILFLSVFLVTACSSRDTAKLPKTDQKKIQLVSSIFPVYEIVRELAGDQADVHLMVGANEDAHHYEPSAQAVTLVNEADAFIYSGDEMEYWAPDLLKVVENDALAALQLDTHLDLTLDEDNHEHEEEVTDHDGHNHGNIDPHFWLNPQAVQKQIPRMLDLLTEIDPAGKENYQKNAQKLNDRLEELDQAYHESFVDADRRSFVVQHKAFGHLANRYHLEQLSVGGLSTEVEPNPKDLIKVIEFVKENNTEVIFYQSDNTSAVAETISRETNADISVLYDLENKPQGIEEADNYYFAAMYHNLNELKKVIY